MTLYKSTHRTNFLILKITLFLTLILFDAALLASDPSPPDHNEIKLHLYNHLYRKISATAAQCLDNRIPQRAAVIATLAALVWYNTQSEDCSIDNPQGLTQLQRKMHDYNRGLLDTVISYALIASIFLHVYETEITLTTQWTKERLHALHTFLLTGSNDGLAIMAHD